MSGEFLYRMACRMFTFAAAGIVIAAAWSFYSEYWLDRPAVRFAASGHSIADAAPGENVRVTWAFTKTRDCATVGAQYIVRGVDGIDRAAAGAGPITRPPGGGTISYEITVPPETPPGPAIFSVAVHHQCGARTVRPAVSPDLSMTVREPGE